jgi:hypothetical protein
MPANDEVERLSVEGEIGIIRDFNYGPTERAQIPLGYRKIWGPRLGRSNYLRQMFYTP